MSLYSHECDNCGEEFESVYKKHQLCSSCVEERAVSRLSNIQVPEGGWPRGSDIDRL